MKKKAKQYYKVRNKRPNELTVVFINEVVGVKRSNRLIGLKRRSCFLQCNGKRVALTGEQGVQFLAAIHKTKQPDCALKLMLKSMPKSGFLFQGDIPSLAIRFDGVKTNRRGGKSIVFFRFKLLSQSEENGEKNGELEDPGSLGTHRTCRYAEAEDL
ncbi:hypothetical protein [Collinsella sp. An271]|uniref:hypothetical protein n=1 Tax=Collinsella sp. An271 TaxID=1965616 RepID=UPI0011812E62|nr:hypothetical protein [Collinsella sp. An271]